VFKHQCGHIVVPDDPAIKAAKQAIVRRQNAEENHARAMRNAARNAVRMKQQEERRKQQLLRQQEQQRMQQQQQQQQQQQHQHFMQQDAISAYKPKTTFVSATSQSPYGAPVSHFAPMTISTPQNVLAPQSSGPISYDPRGPVFMSNGPLPPVNYSRQIHTFADEMPQNFGTSISYHTEANTFAKIKI
jgi:DNA-directed RNA polymerase subunit M/transcription elongation factor TFIIS